MTSVWLFYIMGTWVTPSLMGIHILEEISSWKSETLSYHVYTLVYTMLMKNIGFKQAKKERSQISHFIELLKGVL